MILDLDQRLRARQETNRSLVVEASAGTGKTRTLVDRILHLVLQKGPQGDPISLKNIAAITFTEKAAGEMKLRLRREFEEISLEAGPKGERARQALRDLDEASISTIHAFAVALLKERPIEAGLDPRFQALDETHSGLFFLEIWEAWLDRAIWERDVPIERALRAGLGLNKLQQLAGELRKHRRMLSDLKPGAPPTKDEILLEMESSIGEGKSYSSLVKDPRDRLANNLETAIRWLEKQASALASDGESTTAGVGATDSAPRRSRNVGSQANWEGGRETKERVQQFMERCVQLHERYSRMGTQQLLYDLDRWIVEKFLPQWENQKRHRGFLDFDDQLLLARDLLRRSPAARSDFQRKFAALLVDEFQDTDPVQLEIVLLLSSTDLNKTDPADLKPDPGRIFIVGDPKQSIYRFRGADVETYLDVVAPQAMKARGLERVEITTNFRSVPSILQFVDAAFQGRMSSAGEANYQPDYLPFGGHGERSSEPAPPSVHLFWDQIDQTDPAFPVQDSFEREAARIARLIAQMEEDKTWRVTDRATKEENTHEVRRPPRNDEIAILLPVLTKVDVLEDALRDAGIRYALEGGKFYYARSEVSSAINVLRAVANPNDRVALYASLRSIFFGLSDEDLLRAHIEGQAWNYLEPVPRGSPLERSYEILRELHRHRHERRASETFETLLRETGAREVLATRHGGLQSLANLGKLGRNLRALQSDRTFSEVLDLLARMDEEGMAESESRIVEERGNAVRLLTIHKAKGLDFPIVIVAGLGQRKRNDLGMFLADPHRKNFYAISVGDKDSGLRLPGWEELAKAEREREKAESIRLLYVALTRARDHLVISTHSPWKWQSQEEKWVPNFANTRLEPLADFLSDLLQNESSLARRLDMRALDVVPQSAPRPLPTKEVDWAEALRGECAELHRLIYETPSARDLRPPAESSHDFQEEARVQESARDRAIRLGVAYHEAMQSAELSPTFSPVERAAEAGRRHGLDSVGIQLVETMMRRSLESDLIERAGAAASSGRRIWRELSFVRPVASSGPVPGIVEGKIDLMFEENGEWVVVDYKTDQIPPDVQQVDAYFGERYAGQLHAYAAALRALGLQVKAGYLLLARTGQQIEIPLAIDD